LVFDGTTLAQAAAEFNRYHAKQLVISDAATAEIRIGGSFEAANLDAFVRLLRNSFGLQIMESGWEIRVSD
jgi:transmembrane sensor